MAYATYDQFAAWADLVDIADQAAVNMVLDAAAAQIDGHCNRSFPVAGAAEARTFTAAADGRTVFVDDFQTAPAPTASVAGTAVDVEAVPAPAGRPASALTGAFGVGVEVEVTASWGWAAVPDQVVLANLMLGLKLWERRKSPAGIQGSVEAGFIRVHGIDRDIDALLAPFVRLSAVLA